MLAVIEATDEDAILHNDIYDLPPLAHWGRGRVTLLGDAAHAMTPNLGQGAGQAIEDALALATCLTRESGVSPALKAYERQRLARANTIAQRSHHIGQVAQWERPLTTRMRNILARMTPSQVLLQQLEWVLQG